MSEKFSHSDQQSGKPEKKGDEDFPLQEYRLVPINESEKYGKKGNQINLFDLYSHFWENRKTIYKIIGSFVLIGLLVAFLSPEEYQTEATLMPETQNQQGNAGNLLQQYGSLLGINGNIDITQDGMIPPQLYPTIVQSLPFQLEVLNQKVSFSEYDTTIVLFTFFEEIHTPSFFTYLFEYSIGLPGKIIELIKKEETSYPLPKGFETDSTIKVTKEQMEIIENLRERITVNLNEDSGILTLTAEMPDPEAAAEVGKISIDLLKNYVTRYRTKKAMEDLEFVQQQFQRAKKRFREAQIQLADFRDSNVGQLTEKARTQEQLLQSEYDLAFNVYNSLAQQVEQAKLKVQEQTPVVSIIQPIHVPIKQSSPKRVLILIVSLMFGLFMSVAWLTLKEWWKEQSHN